MGPSALSRITSDRRFDKGHVDPDRQPGAHVWRLLAGQPQAVQRRESLSEQGSELTLRDVANRSRDQAKSRLLTELKGLTPTGFEHFCMELLQQFGFNNVAVTRRAGDGGIDGFGDFRQGAVSIRSAFQAKRWGDAQVAGQRSTSCVARFRENYNHGVFITTSRFTKEATEASYKKGAITILLLDGGAIAELMIDRGIGVVGTTVCLCKRSTPSSLISTSPSTEAAYTAFCTEFSCVESDAGSVASNHFASAPRGTVCRRPTAKCARSPVHCSHQVFAGQINRQCGALSRKSRLAPWCGVRHGGYVGDVRQSRSLA